MFLIFSFPYSFIFSKLIPPLTAISSYPLIHFLTFLSSMSHMSLVFFFSIFIFLFKSHLSPIPIFPWSKPHHNRIFKMSFKFSLYSSIQKFWLSLNLLSLSSLISSLSQHCSSPRNSLQVCCSVNLLTLISSFNFCSHLHRHRHLHLLLLFLFLFSFLFSLRHEAYLRGGVALFLSLF